MTLTSEIRCLVLLGDFAQIESHVLSLPRSKDPMSSYEIFFLLELCLSEEISPCLAYVLMTRVT